MGFKRFISRIAERVTGTYILPYLPRGVDVFNDIAVSLPNYRIDVIFDVGANEGQSARAYLALFPSAGIYCFEPVAKTFSLLQANTERNRQVHCFKLALGAIKGQGRMCSQGTSTTNRLLDKAESLSSDSEKQVEQVDILTLDEFCESHEIKNISYLKIDTEGHDLDVLKGAALMLARQAVDLVELEAGMNPGNKQHVPFELLKQHMESNGYFLFGFYEQVNEWLTHESHLRRTNPVFISSRMIETHRGASTVGS